MGNNNQEMTNKAKVRLILKDKATKGYKEWNAGDFDKNERLETGRKYK